MNDLVTTTQKLAEHNDRWLFVFALVVLATVMVAVARYFVQQYERLHGEHQAVLEQLIGTQAKSQEELTRVVATNTEALRAVASELRWCKERNLAAGGSRE